MLEAGSLYQLIERRADASPDATLLVDENERGLTFAEYRDQVDRVAAGFAERGLHRGDVVSWQLPTWLETFVLAGALARLEVVQNPILTIYREREVSFIVRQAQPKLLIVPTQVRGFDFEAFAHGVTEGTDTDVMVIDSTSSAGPAERDLPTGEPSTLPPPPGSTRADDAPTRWLFYSSGTTADPKGAQHTDHTIMVTAKGMAQRLELTPADRNALAFPFSHIAGPIWLATSLMVPMQQLITAAFDPNTTPQQLSQQGVTLAGSGTVFHMAYLAAQRKQPDTPLFPHVRVFPGGGAPKPPQLHYDLKKELGGIGIASGYGLTEAPILTMSGTSDSDEALANTEGFPMPGVELRVVTLEGKEAGVEEEGEIRAKAPQMMRGYLDQPLNAEAFDDDGWFRTGDLGRLDAEGNVTITGRLKDIIIRKGENISAKEVEDVLFTHPAIADVAVIGIPDAAVGERACAIIVTAEGAQPPTLADLQPFLEQKGLMKQKWPEQLEVVEALPRNPAGKVLKRDLKATLSS